MEKLALVVAISALFLCPLFQGCTVEARRESNDGSEEWGYVEVRPKAHMFWWLYKSPYRVKDSSKPWPIILWLQGGPGASGVGIGNFEEIGPLDTNLNPRNSTWLQIADLLFVDNPVGTGYSFVEDPAAADLFVKTDTEAADDLTTLLIKLFNGDQILQKSPLYIVAESYGGKYAVTLALAALRAIDAGKLKLTLGGVALGDSWISPEDFVFSWAPLLKDISRLDNNGVKRSNSIAKKIRDHLIHGEYVEATSSWSELESVITRDSNSVDFYNFLLDGFMDSGSAVAAEEFAATATAVKRYSSYLDYVKATPGSSDGDLSNLMDGPIRKKLKIIPQNITWGGQSDAVFNYLEGDFMKPRIKEVDELLARGVNVTVYNGQLDLICATMGTEAWVEKLKWDGLQEFLGIDRTPLYCGKDTSQGTKSVHKIVQKLPLLLDSWGRPLCSGRSAMHSIEYDRKHHQLPCLLPVRNKQGTRIYHQKNMTVGNEEEGVKRKWTEMLEPVS